MRLTATLALRDLLRNRLLLLCNVAILVGVLVPLMVLSGVKNGVYLTLADRLLSAPDLLQIDTTGEASLTAADAGEVAGWEDVAFVTLKTRSLFDFVAVRAVGGRQKTDAVVFATGPGDPALPAGLVPGPGDAVVTEVLASTLGLAAGDRVQIITQSEARSPQLVQERRIAAVVPARAGEGSLVLLDLDAVDRIEAFYDGYALPENGLPVGRDPATRRQAYEGMRVFATSIDALGALDRRLSQRLGLRTVSRAPEAARLRDFGHSLDLALALAAGVAALGLATALLFGFWSEVQRKRRALATLALLGVPPHRVALFPVVQALVTAVLGLAAAFGLTAVAARVAEALFGGSFATSAGLVVLRPAEAALIAAAVLVLVVLASGAAAAVALRIDPASVLREDQG